MLFKKFETNFFGMVSTSGYEHAGTFEMEVYTDDDASNPDYYSEIWIPVK